ncbi:MAG TPA: DnaJ domain-containing protein [Pyrinomonadaceae bacterium]|jgi:curved DNA-binding protein CbpA
MSSPNNLEIQGSLHEHPLAELLVEAAAAHLSGSFRLGSHAQKAIIYLRNGEIVFAVSNARQHRLFEMLLQSGRLNAAQISGIPNFSNDQALSEALLAQESLSESDIQRFFTRQVEEIVKSAIAWQEGEWAFSALVRIKESINYKIDLRKILFDYARTLSPDKIVRRFRSFQETFGANPTHDSQLQLATQEAFLLSRFEKSFLKIQEVVTVGGLPEAMTMQTLYILWLGGFLYRQNWNAAFSERKISAILSAKLALKPDELAEAEVEEPLAVAEEAPRRFQQVKAEIVRAANGKAANVKKEETKPPAPEIVKAPDRAEERRLTEVYLQRVEEAETLYQVLGVAPDVKSTEIKSTYFALAKRFHPDLFHKETGTETHRRIQVAFTEIAHAYEILKDESAREIYDFKNRDRISAAAASSSSGTNTPKAKPAANSVEAQAAMAKESFDQGYSYLMDGDYKEALPLLARAVHLSPANARYHIFYGKVLAADEKSVHKAESEMQAAIKLDPNNSVFRLMLAEFYVEIGLYRRAEGELQRLLTMFPNNKEAQDLLDSLPKK